MKKNMKWVVLVCVCLVCLTACEAGEGYDSKIELQYDYYHGLNAHKDTSYAHCKKWVKKYIDPTGFLEGQYVYQDLVDYYSRGFSDIASYATYQKWYKENYMRGYMSEESFLTYIKKNNKYYYEVYKDKEICRLYDYAHGLGAHHDTSYAHCKKWVKKHILEKKYKYKDLVDYCEGNYPCSYSMYCNWVRRAKKDKELSLEKFIEQVKKQRQKK